MASPPATGPITSPYGPRKGSEIGPGVGPFHYGSDRRGDGNFFPEGGTVVFAGYAGAFGNAILVRNGAVVWNLAHHKNLNGRRVGQVVVERERSAPMGATGLAFGVHVHCERRTGGGDTIQSGVHSDPEQYFNALASGGSTPFEEDDMFNDEDRKVLQIIRQLLTETQQWKGIGALVSETYQMVGIIKQVLLETESWEGIDARTGRTLALLQKLEQDVAVAAASDAARDAAITLAISSITNTPEGLDLGELRQVLTDVATTAASQAITAADLPTEETIVQALFTESERRRLAWLEAELTRVQNELGQAQTLLAIENPPAP